MNSVTMKRFCDFIIICGVLIYPSFAQVCIIDQLTEVPPNSTTVAIGASFSMSIRIHRTPACDSKAVQINGATAAIHRTASNSITYTAPWDATRLSLQNDVAASSVTFSVTLLKAQASDTGSVFTVAAGIQTSVGVGLKSVTNCGNSTNSGVNQNVPDGKIFMSNHTFTCMSGYEVNDQFAICQADATWNTTNCVEVSTPSSTTDVTAETTMPVTDSGQPQSRSLDSGEAALVAVGTCAGITIIVFVGLFCVVSKKYPEETVKWKICAACTCVLCVGVDGICGRCCCCCVNCSICTCCCCCFAVAAKRRGKKKEKDAEQEPESTRLEDGQR